MNKKFWGVIGGVGALLVIAAAIWSISSYWHGYTSAETVHEYDQASEIKNALDYAQLAMQKGQLAIDQQRVKWLEERIFEMEQKYGCEETRITASCSGKIWRTYQKYLKEYNFLLEKISEQTGGG